MVSGVIRHPISGVIHPISDVIHPVVVSGVIRHHISDVLHPVVVSDDVIVYLFSEILIYHKAEQGKLITNN